MGLCSLQTSQSVGIPGAKRFYSRIVKISQFENLDVLALAPSQTVVEKVPTVDYV